MESSKTVKEIEVKVRVTDLDSIRKKLEDMDCVFENELIQRDTLFFPEGVTFENVDSEGVNVLRIRDENGKLLLTLKKHVGHSLGKVEKETVIEDKDQMADMIELLGFYEAFKVNKIRNKCKYKDMEICLDDVEGLGTFIEVEKISDSDVEKTQEEMFKFLQESLGVKKEDRVTEGYDIILKREKR